MKWITVGVLISALVSTSAYAGPADDSATRAGGGIRKSVEQIRFSRDNRDWSYTPAARRGNSTAQKAGAAFALGSLGLLGGAWLGAWTGALLEGNCRCDDPGLSGALIGMPIGGTVGGALGAMVGWRLAR
jgi:hypothetical protein